MPTAKIAGISGRDSYAPVPPELKRLPQWIVWCLEDRDGKPTKVPYDAKANGQRRKARSNNPATWAPFPVAVSACEAGGYNGIGFNFAGGDGVTGIDLDHVIDPETGAVEPWAVEVLDRFKGTYCEVSPSGTGLRIFAYGKPSRSGKGTVQKRIEAYDHGSPRYLTVTGQHWSGSASAVTAQQEALDWLGAAYFAPKRKSNEKGRESTYSAPEGTDAALIERALKAKNGAKLSQLLGGDWSAYPSQSEADSALCMILAFWTQDPEQLDRIFRGSGLFREKWDRQHHADGQTYGEATIAHAVASVSSTHKERTTSRARPVQAKTQDTPRPVRDTDTGRCERIIDDSWPRPEWRPESQQRLRDTDLGNCERLFDRAGANLMFLREIGWHKWNGHRWTPDEAAAKRLADGLPQWILEEASELFSQASTSADPAKRKELSVAAELLAMWAKRSEKGATIEAGLTMLERRLIVEPTEADGDHFLLGVVNGTLDLRTGDLRPSRRGDFITKGSPVVFDSAATCPTFERFLARIFRGNPEVINFLQRAVGYTLTGDVREQCIFILHGSGQNGKSTLVDVIERLIGDYARQAAPDLLIAKTGDRHPTEIADLRGARMIATIETGEGRRMAESLVKQLSGGDRLKGRYMRRDFFDFSPTHKLWLATNHRPVIYGTDLGIWRRIRLVPFDEVIGDDEKDPTLPEKLRAELPGILAWAVRGCLEWQKSGLQPPEAVIAATAAYREEQDILAPFIAECCRIDKRAEVRASDLYKAYTAWCSENGEREQSQTNFGTRLTERGFQRAKSAGKKIYIGITVVGPNLRDSRDSTDPISGSTVHKPFTRNYQEIGSQPSLPSPNENVTCKHCAHWSGKCGAGFAVSDPDIPRLCGKFRTAGLEESEADESSQGAQPIAVTIEREERESDNDEGCL